MTIIYGITNCDTVKKARRWLETHNLNYAFHDFRKDGLDRRKADQWLNKLGADVLVNKRGTTWKQLSEKDKQAIDNGNAINLICDNPTLIKRPVLEIDNVTTVGFNESEYQKLFKTK